MIEAIYKIIVGVATECGVSTDEVLSRSRLKSAARARALAMLIIREYYSFSTPEIGRVLVSAASFAVSAVGVWRGRVAVDELGRVGSARRVGVAGTVAVGGEVAVAGGWVGVP